MKRKKVSARQLAKRMGKDYGSIFRLFRPGYNPKLSTLAEIAKAIGCKVRDLIDE